MRESLPMYLENGSVVDDATGRCSRCSGRISSLNHRGVAVPSTKGFCVTSFGFCEPCRLLTPLMFDVVADGSSFKVVPRQWRGWRESTAIDLSSRRK